MSTCISHLLRSWQLTHTPVIYNIDELTHGKPLQNPTLGVLIAEGGMFLGGDQGSGPPKSRCEVLCWGLHGAGVMMAVSLIIPSGHQAAPYRIYAFHWFLWDVNETRETKKDMVEATQSSSLEQTLHLKVDSSQQRASSSDIPPREANSISQPGNLRI
jgi:hypothetical protein